MSEPIDSALKDRRMTRSSSMLPLLLPDLRGGKAAWAGVETSEPLQRGCDQRGICDRLAAKGIRHLIVPLNGPSEDSSLFARKHMVTSDTPGGTPLYDLEHRDEGAFTRLKFLLEAARSAGLIVGLSLFDASNEAQGGPFRRGGNIQELSFSNPRTSKDDARFLTALSGVADWVCSAARGFRGLWIEIFRNGKSAPRALERALNIRVAETLARHGEDLSPARLGPWIAPRVPDILRDKHAAQAAPFDAATEILGTSHDFSEALRNAEASCGSTESDLVFRPVPRRQPALLRFTDGVLNVARREWLWRGLFRGYWPTVAMHVTDVQMLPMLDTLSAIARFGVEWAGRGALRPSTDLLKPMPENSLNSCIAAEDGTGRFFIYFSQPPASGLALKLPIGFYRFYWVDPSAGRILDRGEGAEGGPCVGIPVCTDAAAQILILEQDESPDPLSVW